MAVHAISRAIEHLAARNGFLHRDGKVNCSAVGRFTDLPSTTIMRLLKADSYSSPRVNTIRRISEAFDIRESQLLGYETLDEVGADSPGKNPLSRRAGNKPARGMSMLERPLSDTEVLFISRLRALPAADRNEALRFVEFKYRAVDAKKK